MLRALASLDHRRRLWLDPEVSPLALAVVESGGALAPGVAGATFVADLPVPLTQRLAGGEPPCLLLLDRAPTVRAAPRRPISHELVRSAYRRGTRRIANQEHAELKRAARALASDDDGPGIMATGDPAIDLIGLVAGGVLDGIDLFRRRGEEERLSTALAATPASLEEPIWQPYTYEITTVEAARSGPLRAALVDRGRGRSWVVAQTVREVQRFRVASGRHASDRDLLEGHAGTTALPADLEVWERGGVRPTLSTLSALLAEASATQAPGAADPAAIVAAWAEPSTGSVASRQPDLIEPAAGWSAAPSIEEIEDPASGNSASRLGRPALVEQVTDPDGTRRYRLADPTGGRLTAGR